MKKQETMQLYVFRSIVISPSSTFSQSIITLAKDECFRDVLDFLV